MAEPEFFRDYIESLPGRAYLGGDFVGQARITFSVNTTPMPQIRPLEQMRGGALCDCPECRASRPGVDQAGARARELLLSLLTEGQRYSYQRAGRFQVKTERGAHYQLNAGGAVYRVERDDHPLAQFCVGMPGYPFADQLLGIKLLLEEDESEFLRVANPYGMRPSVPVGLEIADARICMSLKEPEHYEKLARYRPTYKEKNW